MFSWKHLSVLTSVALAACSSRGSGSCNPPVTPGPFIAQTVPADLLRRANHGREILQPDGHFRIAPHFKHVWIDVGAHYLESSRPYLANSPDTLLIGN